MGSNSQATYLITPAQAAQILNLRTATPVLRLIRQGKLTDHGITSDGRSRHEYRLDPSQVRALAAELPPQRAAPIQPKLNLSASGINARLDRIEAQLAAILEILK